MATSLQQQLQKLAVPQTSALVDTKTKESILFDRKEAAKKSRRVIYDLGVSGLQELIAINPNFQQFEVTLFEETTLNFERSVELKEVNELLDRNIRKFLQHLSPYFLLRPAHLCIEWLLRRFQVNEYNRDDLFALALPYHETNTFVRVAQTMRLREDDQQWGWLRKILKPGLPLAKSTIINRAASNAGFLNFVCKNTTEAIRELSGRAHTLQTLINFYASVVVGALDNVAKVEEWHITTILPSLLQGLSSQTVDFTSAAYIISGQLMARSQLTPKLCNAFINRIVVVQYEALRSAAVLLLIWIFDSQQTAKPQFNERSLTTLVQYKWLVPVLAKLARDNTAIQSVCEAIIQSAVKLIFDGHAESELLKGFLERLIGETDVPKATAERIVSCFLDSYIMPVVKEKATQRKVKKSDVIELSDEEMSDDSFSSWYSEVLRKLERKYPEAFDKTIKDALKSNLDAESHRSKALKMAMAHRLKSFDQNSADIYECLYHHNAAIRGVAVQKLLKNFQKYKNQPQNFTVIKECLADRILDDNDEVIAEILTLSTEDFLATLGCEQFVEALFKILYNTTGDAVHSSIVIKDTVKHLTHAAVVDQYDSNLLLLSLMPLLFPNKLSDTVKECIGIILRSPLAGQVTFLKGLKLDNKITNAMDFRRLFLDVITKHKDTPTVVALFQSLSGKDDRFFKAPVNFAHFLLLVTACLKQELTSSESSLIFQQVYQQCKRFRIKLLQEELRDEHQFIPLQLFSDFVLSVTTQTKFSLPQLLQWNDSSEDSDLQCFLSLFDMLAKEAFEQDGAPEKLEWSKTLKEFLDAVLPSPQDKLDFLTNLYTFSKVRGVDSYAHLQLRAFKILSSVLKNKQNDLSVAVKHIMRISVALCSTCDIVRQQALVTLSDLVKHRGDQLADHVSYFVTSVLERYDEISMDGEQYPLVLYLILSSQKKPKQVATQKLRKDFMSFVKTKEALQQSTFTGQILKSLKHFNDKQVVQELLPLGLKVLDMASTEANNVRVLQEPYDEIFTSIVARFEASIIKDLLVDVPEAWSFVEESFARHDVFLVADGKLNPLPCALLESWDEHVYENMPGACKVKFLKLITATVSKSDNDNIFLTANKLLKKCLVECQPLVEIISAMSRSNKAKPATRRKSVESSAAKQSASNVVCIEEPTWKEGLVLLELLENKKKLAGSHHLVSPLFDLLKLCIEMEDQSPLEYTKQLALSGLLHCCRKSRADNIDLADKLPKSTFRIDQIVQCMRSTQNPQTHHNALMLLSYCATMFPQQVLHNIVDIFTFMGSSVVRQDDSYSFHIINNIIESIIPIVVRAHEQVGGDAEKGDLAASVVPVLKVFSDIIMDVPVHRRLPLYTKLMETLGVEQYLWAFLCVVFEANVLHEEKERQQQKKPAADRSEEKFSKRVKICFQLTNSFEPEIIIETCVRLMDYVRTLPCDTAEEEKKGASTRSSANTECSLFDVKARSAKQLRHYRYVIMQFLSAISASPDFLAKLETLEEEDILRLKSKFQNFIIRTLSYAPIVNEAIEKSEDSVQTKYWKVILHHLHDTLDNAISLLSPNMFLVVVNGLMQHQLLSIRRKVVELLINKLQRKDGYFDGCDEKNFHSLLKPLSDIISGILQPDESSSHNEMVFLQQTAMIAIKMLSKLFALSHIEEFKALLGQLIVITKKRASISKVLLATAILTIIEVSANLKAHSLAYLPKYMPQLVQVLRDQAELVRSQPPDNVSFAIIAGIQKLFEALPLFLGPFIVDIITPLSSIWVNVRRQGSDRDHRTQNVVHKITGTWERIAHEVPLRVLVPSVENAYKQLMEARLYNEVGVLMKLLPQAIGRADRAELSTLQNEITALFLLALEFREETWSSGHDKASINATELVIVEAFVAWVLKLSESSFRPLYNKVYDWALRGEETKCERVLTYFRLTHKIADALKSLFVLFAGSFIDDAARLLAEHNTAQNERDFDSIHTDLVQAILNTLHAVFLYDSKGFINQERFEVLHQPIVDQLENRLVLEDEQLQKTLSDCLAQLSMAVSNDILWKQLNYQVLLKTRTNVPEVRIGAFNCCVEIARKLGEEFTPLLPETVPFIAELFEDENPRVEKNTRKAVQELEAILGESLQKYL